jgi:predicted nucleic acid-binding Zn ribbon protein
MADDVTQAAPEARVGSVTFLEAGEATRRRERAVIMLLGAITALLLVLVVGLSVGVFWLARQYDAAQQALQRQAGDVRRDVGAAVGTTRALSRDWLNRQASLSRDLQAPVNALQAEQQRIARVRAGMGEVPDDPFGKADYAIRMSQLALDEALAVNRHIAATQLAIARNLALTPAQAQLLKELDRPGSQAK